VPSGWAGCPISNSFSSGRGRRLLSALKFKNEAEAEAHTSSYSLVKERYFARGNPTEASR
jgi:hypothetical protein